MKLAASFSRLAIWSFALALGSTTSWAVPTLTTPSVLAADLPLVMNQKKLSATDLQSLKNETFSQVFVKFGQSENLPSLIEGLILTDPSMLPKVLDAVPTTTQAQAAATGLGLCQAVADLSQAVTAPGTSPAQAQAAKSLSAMILANVASYVQSDSQFGSAISGSFGIGSDNTGGTQIICRSQTGETVATASVEAVGDPATGAVNAGSDAGVGGAMNNTSSAGFFGGFPGPSSPQGGGRRNRSAFPPGVDPAIVNILNAGNSGSASIVFIPVPVPTTGTGLPLVIGGLFFVYVRHLRQKRLRSL